MISISLVISIFLMSLFLVEQDLYKTTFCWYLWLLSFTVCWSNISPGSIPDQIFMIPDTICTQFGWSNDFINQWCMNPFSYNWYNIKYLCFIRITNYMMLIYTHLYNEYDLIMMYLPLEGSTIHRNNKISFPQLLNIRWTPFFHPIK